MRLSLCSFLLTVLLFAACNPAKKAVQSDSAFSDRIAFYNVENLFDTEDDPKKLDDDFTPEGKQKWDQVRYQQKLSNLHQVIKGLHYPSLLGLCEIENATVLQALSDSCKTASGQYKYVHFESKDVRGIDVALLYDPAHFKVSNSKIIRTDFPVEDGKEYTSRDILQVYGVYRNKYPMYVFVNHWPSRRGGLEKSEPKRVLVAQNLKKAITEIWNKDAEARIVILGDFNDEPVNKSIAETLNAGHLEGSAKAASVLYNCTYDLDAAGKGTYNYRGEWNQLDQIIASGSFLGTQQGFGLGEVGIFREEWMMYEDKKYGATPSRTYGGPNYYGGYSDHLPVYVELRF